MDQPVGNLEQGSIVWAWVPDPKGEEKCRPAVVITATDEIVLNGPVAVVAVSASIPETLPESHIELPWHPARHPATHLSKRCAAVCNWLAKIRPSDIVEIRGYVPARWLLPIVDLVNQLNPDEEL